MAKKMSRALTMGLVLLLCLGIAGCSSSTVSTEALTEITLNEVAHSIFYAPMYVAIEEGYFEEEGISLTLVTGYGADKTMAALLTGEADIGFMGSESTIYTYVEGTDDPVINFAQLTQRAGNFIVAREPIEDFTYDMLIGSEVLAGRAGGMPQMVFEYVLDKYGIDKDTDIEMDQSIDFGSTAAAFSGGKGDFTVEFEPYATGLELIGDGYIIASLGESSGYVPYTAFCATSSYFEENGDSIESFTRAIQKGLDYTLSHTPEEIAEIIAPQFSETDELTLTTIIERYYDQDTWPSDLVFSEESFDLLQDILISSEVLEEKVAYDALVDTTYAEAVK
ncbi:MAG: ABC transporter substrate-binding protein [Lachnospiraceae bacterium]